MPHTSPDSLQGEACTPELCEPSPLQMPTDRGLQKHSALFEPQVISSLSQALPVPLQADCYPL